MARFSYPHVIDDGAGERLTFTRRITTPNGDRLEGENLVAPGRGPVMHSHLLQSEGLMVKEGRIGYQRLGDSPRFAGPGERVDFKPGEAHRFWNAGDEPLRCEAYLEPADNVEYFLSELFASKRRNGGERPSLFDAAYLIRRYRSEYVMYQIPMAVQRLVFPVVVAIGTVLGRYKRYADAPAPIRR